MHCTLRVIANLPIAPSLLFKSFEFGNGSRISDKKLIMFEFKYLQNKNW